MARPDVLNRLKELGWDGPTSYTLPYLNEMIATLESGTSVEELKASRKKTSSPEVKGQGRQPRGEWVADTPPDSEEGTVWPNEFTHDGVQWRNVEGEGWQRFVPTLKPAKQRPEKGTWEVVEDNPPHTVVEASGEALIEGVRYRWNTVAVMDGEQPTGDSVVRWEKFVPTPPKEKKAKLPKQTADFDPREMLRVFENHDMRVRTGGRDWTMLPTEWLEEQLNAARGRGDAAVLIEVDGSQETLDCVVLEALITVKKRLALREEAEVNGDGAATPEA